MFKIEIVPPAQRSSVDGAMLQRYQRQIDDIKRVNPSLREIR